MVVALFGVPAPVVSLLTEVRKAGGIRNPRPPLAPTRGEQPRCVTKRGEAIRQILSAHPIRAFRQVPSPGATPEGNWPHSGERPSEWIRAGPGVVASGPEVVASE